MKQSPSPAPKDRPIKAKWIIRNARAPLWKEEGKCVILWHPDLDAWIRKDTGTLLTQAPGDYLRVLEWNEEPQRVDKKPIACETGAL